MRRLLCGITVCADPDMGVINVGGCLYPRAFDGVNRLILHLFAKLRPQDGDVLRIWESLSILSAGRDSPSSHFRVQPHHPVLNYAPGYRPHLWQPAYVISMHNRTSHTKHGCTIQRSPRSGGEPRGE